MQASSRQTRCPMRLGPHDALRRAPKGALRSGQRFAKLFVQYYLGPKMPCATFRGTPFGTGTASPNSLYSTTWAPRCRAENHVESHLCNVWKHPYRCQTLRTILFAFRKAHRRAICAMSESTHIIAKRFVQYYLRHQSGLSGNVAHRLGRASNASRFGVNMAYARRTSQKPSKRRQAQPNQPTPHLPKIGRTPGTGALSQTL